MKDIKQYEQFKKATLTIRDGINLILSKTPGDYGKGLELVYSVLHMVKEWKVDE